MQGRERMDRQLLDAGALVGHLVPPGSMFAFLAAHRGGLFGDDDFADALSDRARSIECNQKIHIIGEALLKLLVGILVAGVAELDGGNSNEENAAECGSTGRSRCPRSEIDF